MESTATAEPASSQGQIDELVRQLGAESRREREAAEQGLLQMGTRILPLLPSPSTSMPPAITRAITRVQNTLELQAGKEATQPSTVTIRQSGNVREILALIEQQTENPVACDPQASSQRIVVAWERTPFWSAFTELEGLAKLQQTADSQAEQLLLIPLEQAPPPLPSATSGPCLIQVLSAGLKPSFVDPSRRILHVRWKVQAEPRLRPMYLIVADADLKAENAPLAPQPLSPEARRELPVDRWSGCEIDTAFDVAGGEARGTFQFSGRAILKIAALPLPITFEHLETGAMSVIRRGRVNAVLRDVHFDEPQRSLRLRVAIAYDRGGPEFESHRMWIYQNAAWLESTDGKRRRPDRVDLVQIGQSGGTLEYGFDDIADLGSQRFVYEAPTLIVDVPVEFADLKVAIP
jgi:hypothetical protein